MRVYFFFLFFSFSFFFFFLKKKEMQQNEEPAPPVPRLVRECVVKDRSHTRMMMTYCVAMHDDDLSFVAHRHFTYITFSMKELACAESWERAQKALHVVKGVVDGTVTLFAHWLASAAVNYVVNGVRFDFPTEWDAEPYRVRFDDPSRWTRQQKRLVAKKRRTAEVIDVTEDDVE